MASEVLGLPGDFVHSTGFLKVKPITESFFVSGSPLLYWCLKLRPITDSVRITYTVVSVKPLTKKR